MNRPIVARFRSHYIKTSGCWYWIGSLDDDGYGRFRTTKRALLSHRVSYELYIGPIPESMDVLHHCDNPSCVRPDHLFLGTHDDNMKDMVAKGRQSRLKGEDHGRAKLTEDDVRTIRLSKGVSSGLSLARRFGVHHTVIYDIWNKRIWGHI